ncbi:MAG: FecR domain-containing protein [Spirochaetales bacterium]|nr:FecR domain-containing protein [Spirochaetales bacterium]
MMKRDIKEWIRHLDESDFYSLVKDAKTGLDTVGNEKSSLIKEEIRSFSPRSRPPVKGALPAVILRFGIAAAIVIGLAGFLFFMINGMSGLRAVPVITSGRIEVSKDDIGLEMAEGAPFREGESIATGASSSCTFTAGGTLVKMNQHTRIRLAELSKKEVRIGLEYGEIQLDTGGPGEAITIGVPTFGVIARFAGIALVRYGNDSAYIALYEGRVEIRTDTAGEKQRHIQLEAGEDVLFTEGADPVRGRLSGSTGLLLETFSVMADIPVSAGGAGLRIDTGETGVGLFIDDVFIQLFDDSIVLSLSPGEHSVRLEKEGYVPYKEIVALDAMRTKTIKPGLMESDPGHDGNETGSKKRKFGDVETVYAPGSTGTSKNTAVLGFAASSGRIIAVCGDRLVCFDGNGDVAWERIFERKERIVFESTGRIYRGNLYIPTYYKLLVVDIASGSYRESEAPGIIGDGIGMGAKGGLLYMPYPDGMYVFDMNAGTASPEALFVFQNPLTPLLTEKGICLSSFIAPEIALFSYSGEPIRRGKLPAPCVCPPVEAAGYIIAGDNGGTVTKSTSDLEKTADVQLETGIASLAVWRDEYIYAVTVNGKLYRIRFNGMTEAGKITIDKIPDPGIYLYKRPVLIENDILIGTDGGEIAVVDCVDMTVRGMKKISGDPASCPVFLWDDYCYTGTKNGTIFRIEYK